MNQDTKLFKKMMLLLTRHKLQGRRHAICWHYSKGRTESSKELINAEVLQIINDLEDKFKEFDSADKMRKKIISMAHEMGWQLPASGLRPKADMQRIDAWTAKYGYLHKALNSYEYTELPVLVTQFESFYKSYLNGF